MQQERTRIIPNEPQDNLPVDLYDDLEDDDSYVNYYDQYEEYEYLFPTE